MTFARHLKGHGEPRATGFGGELSNEADADHVAQMEALKRYRSGGEQKMPVQHFHVAEGGRAIVANVNAQTAG